ncbi:MAG: type III-A CRISPR-associated RAMP protein Csm3 [Chloroflexaceae bacterium]|nr:type III-A CRISPR-associated RAMP protein Csm3 [Chloroflexaceae bacterium]
MAPSIAKRLLVWVIGTRVPEKPMFVNGSLWSGGMVFNTRMIQLQGRLFLDFTLRAETGIHIGGSPGILSIGNVDNPVVRNPMNSQPYIPGSSLRGKMRAQLEKHHGLAQNHEIGQVRIHMCRSEEEYQQSALCQVFGIPGGERYRYARPSRLLVRDAPLSPQSAEELSRLRTDMPFTEIKWEAAIDRVTSVATPRQQERVPAGAEFCGSLVFSLYSFNQHQRERDLSELALFTTVLEGLELVQEDYLGGLGSRGSGKVSFNHLTLTLKQNKRYGEPDEFLRAETLHELQKSWADLLGRLLET